MQGASITSEQIIIFALFGIVLAMLVWGRLRYDLVSFAALIAAVVLGVVPVEEAFSGFGHEATMIVLLVLVVSFGLSRSGAIELVTRRMLAKPRSVPAHLGILGGLAAALSSVMNNVAALALTMPVDIQAAHKAGRSPSLTLMPLAAATILGGLVTLIGTPANIIVSSYRRDVGLGAFGMFDYAPVGLVCAFAGLAFIAIIGWRLIPQRSGNAMADLAAIEDYVAELVVNKETKAIGQRVSELDTIADENDVIVLGLIRKAKRLPGRARGAEIVQGDLLVVEGSPDALNAFAAALALGFQGRSGEAAALSSDLGFFEAVVGRGSRLIGRSANDVQMLRGFGISLLGISRAGKTLRERVRRTRLQAGDVLLLLGQAETMDEALSQLECLPLATRPAMARYDKAIMAISLFVGAVMLAVFGLFPLVIGLSIVVIAYALLDIVPIRELYDAIDWPIIVLLGSLIPMGVALETTGGTALITSGLAALTIGLPAWVAVAAVLIVTMFLSDILNNAATAVIAAPVAHGLAQAMGVSSDPFLMAVAIGASCAFLTPIGHQNNLLIMGPGGYRFSDYWKFGLPLEALIILVGVPAILFFWPL